MSQDSRTGGAPAGDRRAVRLIRIDETMCAHLDASKDEFEKTYQATVGEQEATARDAVAQTLALVARLPRAARWGGYLAVDEETGRVIGTCGFKHGPEENGRVEITYFTFPGHEGKGYATAMATELLHMALGSHEVREVVAHTLPEPNASTRILEKIGLRCTGPVEHPEDGRTWRWTNLPK
jgi:RimJ/RimL family protein N-acetyltransferase